MDKELNPGIKFIIVQILKFFFISLVCLVVITGIAALILPLNAGNLNPEIIPVNSILLIVLVLVIISALITWYLTSRSVRQRKSMDLATIYFHFLNKSDDAIIVSDVEGKCIYANEAAYKSLDYTKEEYFKCNVFSHIAPESLALIQPELKKLVEDNEAKYESALIRKDKALMPVEVNSQIIELRKKRLILSIIRDFTERKHVAEELSQSAMKLKRAMEGTINTISLAVEIRDPYTAGHQQRVSRLAVAIASEMKLSHDQIEGIEVAGNLHDIGKIYVPAEILSKPGKLKENEFNLVKDHAEVGYNLIKSIEFSWPIATIVLQHHERYNGSGYPNGLKGDEIIIEAAIIAVADVVESMASHRPYRPAHNIEKALLEILQNRGILYHPDVVDACMLLFNEKKFSF